MEQAEATAMTGFSLALIVALAALAIPIPESWLGTSLEFYLPFVVSAFYGVANCTTMFIFVSSLAVYKSKSRRAYYWIVAGLVLAVLGTIQMPVLSGFGLWNSPWATSGAVVVPFILSGLALYTGMRQLGRIVGVKGITSLYIIPIATTIIFALICIMLPHPPTGLAEPVFDVGNAITVWPTVFYFFSGILGWHITQHMGRHYTAAMSWLTALAFLACSIPFSLIAGALLTGASRNLPLYTLLLMIVTALVGLKASIAFAQTEEY